MGLAWASPSVSGSGVVGVGSGVSVGDGVAVGVGDGLPVGVAVGVSVAASCVTPSVKVPVSPLESACLYPVCVSV